jgi:uncharacterized protein
MEILGTQLIPAARNVVWDALNDPVVLRRCLPGCESVERVSAQEFKVVVATAIGPLRAKFNGALRMTEMDPPASCVMVFEGQGGAVGFGQGSANVELRESSGATELSYAAKAQVGGKLAQVGSRLIDSVARKMSDDFFKAFMKQFQAEPPQAAAAPAAQADPVGAAALPAAAPPAVPSSPVPALAPAAASQAAAHGNGSTFVPGWWLAVAAVLGSALTIASSLLLR